jgi:hypothetical protein
MKTILLINILLLGFATHAISQQCATSLIQSPIINKPQANASINCTSMVVQWQGNPDQSYKLMATVKDATTGKIIKTISTSDYKQTGQNYAATIPVTTGTKLSWSLQGISTINGRKFASYPLRGKEIIVPECTTTSITAKGGDAAAAKANDKFKVTMFPNPVSSVLNLQLNSKVSEKTIRVADMYGRILISQKGDQNTTQLDVTKLIQGTYIVQIVDAKGNMIFTGKFIKM